MGGRQSPVPHRLMEKRTENLIAFANSVKTAKAYRSELLKQATELIQQDTANKTKERIIAHRTIREINEQCQLLEQIINSFSNIT